MTSYYSGDKVHVRLLEVNIAYEKYQHRSSHKLMKTNKSRHSKHLTVNYWLCWSLLSRKPASQVFPFCSNYFQTETVAAFSQVRLAHPWMHFIIWCVGGAKLINKSMENANIEMFKVSWRSRFGAKKSRLTLFAFCRYREKKRCAACCVPPDDRMIVTLWKMSFKEEQLLTGNASDWCFYCFVNTNR